MIAKFLKVSGWTGLIISALWLIEWYLIELTDNSIFGLTAYFPFSQIILISVLSHIATISVNKRPILLRKEENNILDDFS